VERKKALDLIYWKWFNGPSTVT